MRYGYGNVFFRTVDSRIMKFSAEKLRTTSLVLVPFTSVLLTRSVSRRALAIHGALPDQSPIACPASMCSPDCFAPFFSSYMQVAGLVSGLVHVCLGRVLPVVCPSSVCPGQEAVLCFVNHGLHQFLQETNDHLRAISDHRNWDLRQPLRELKHH